MPVELYHFSCDINHRGRQLFSPKMFAYVSEKKNVKETLMACFLLQNQEEKKSWEKTFFPGLGLSSTTT